MEADVLPSTNGTQGLVVPTLPPALAEYPEMMRVVMEHTWQQITARDELPEQRAHRADRRTFWMGGLLAFALLIVAYLVWDRRQVQAFVQVVQETEEGRLVQIGVPKRVLDYEPGEAAWEDMLAEWTRRSHWRGKDRDKEEKLDGRWVRLHTCPSAHGFLDGLEKREKSLYKPGALVQVNIRSITKTPTPESYQVLWEKSVISPDKPKAEPEWFTTTFTVGRIDLKTLADAQDNRLGMCVASFQVQPHAN